MRRCGEAAHVVTQFRQDLLDAEAGDAGDGIQPVERRLEWAGVLLDPGIEEGDLLVEKLDVIEQALELEDVVRGDPAQQGFPQLGLFAWQ